ncbi:hypothetical protein Q5530_16530 [Saccharothrix sp. BKS2]|uniref:hypothetical protein n=1 Tax=Saccharothrix sp. BKS2 TaxID=3064400 RepID=UPI0039E8AC72
MSDNEQNPSPRPASPPLIDFEEQCPDCAVAVDEAHVHGGCDIACCLVTGRQRLMCDLDHDCGQDIWTGWRPGHLDCERLGWMIGPGFPDLHRLYTQAIWDPAHRHWTAPA